MNKVRGLLLAAIAALSAAGLGAEAIRKRLRRFTEDFDSARLTGRRTAAHEEYPALGRKSGAAAVADGSAPPTRRNGSAAAAILERPDLRNHTGGGPIRNGAGRRTAGHGGDSAPSAAADAYPHDTVHDITLEHVHGPIGYVRELFKRFSGDYCPAWAASLSFFSILSIAPILLCGLAVLEYLMHNPDEATLRVQELLARMLPGGGIIADHQAADLIRQFNVQTSVHTLYAKRGVAGIIGIVSLFWASMQIFVNASAPMNAAFRTRETRGWVKLRLVSLGLLLGAGPLFLFALAPAYIGQSLKISDTDTVLSPILSALLVLIGVVVNAVMFAIIYKVLPSPSANVTWKAAGMAGSIVAILWEVAKEAFAYYLGRFANYDKVYGSLGTLIGLILWIYYTSMILLLGAEIAKLYLDANAAKRESQSGS
jgi:membrane protein